MSDGGIKDQSDGEEFWLFGYGYYHPKLGLCSRADREFKVSDMEASSAFWYAATLFSVRTSEGKYGFLWDGPELTCGR